MLLIRILICILLLTSCQNTQPMNPQSNEPSIQKLSTAPSTQPSQAHGFSDINTHWAKESIEMMKKRDIVAGKGNGRFEPDANVTRAEFAAFLLRTLNIKPELPETLHFKDTFKDEWYAASVETAYKEGLIGGYDDQTFRPGNEISRLEMALLLVRAIKRDKPTLAAPRSELYHFNDVDQIGTWAKDDLAIAVKTGLMGGLPGNMFAPNGKATRAQSVVALNRILLYQSGSLKKPQPQREKNALPLGVNLTEWEFNEEHARIYAISETDQLLYVITTDPLAVETKIQLAGKPSDLEYWDQKVYVTIPEKRVINVVDLASQQVVKSFDFSSIVPDQIAIDHTADYTKLFFTEYTKANLAALGVLDLRTGKVEMISSKLQGYPNNVWNLRTLYARPKLTVDRSKHVLWIGEHGDTSSELYKMDTKDYAKAGPKNLYVPVGDPIPHGDHVFFGGRRYNSQTYADEGRYTYDRELLYVTDQYVFGPTEIYDRSKFNVVGYYGKQASLVAVDKNNTIYIFSPHDQTVHAMTIDLKFEPFKYGKNGKNNIHFGNNKMEKWVLDPSLPYLYAISLAENKLLYIRTDTMTIENELIVGPEPSDIELYGDQIYISHYGTNDLYITDRRFSNQIEKVTLDAPQLDIEVANKRIFYEGLDSFYKPNYEGYLINSYKTKVYDMDQKKISGLFPNAHFNYDILDISADDSNLLIQADYELRVYNPESMELLRTAQIGKHKTIMIKDNEVYTDNLRYELTTFAETGSIHPYIKAITDDYVFVNNQVYTRSDLRHHADLLNYMSKGKVDHSGQFFVAITDNTITKYSSVDAYIEEKIVKYRPDTLTSRWSFDRTTEKLYGLRTGNSLAVLNTKDMTFTYPVLQGDFQGKTDVAADNDRLYIPIPNVFAIQVVDANTYEIIETIDAEQPFRVKVAGDKLLYFSFLQDSNKEGNLYLYDMNSKITTVVKNENGDPFIVKKEDNFEFIDGLNEVIIKSEYYGDDDFFHSRLMTFSGEELKKTAEYVVEHGTGSLIVNQGEVYVGNKQFDVRELSTVKRKFDHSLLYVTEDYALSGYSIFNKQTGEMLNELPTKYNGRWGVITPSGKIVLYIDDNIGFLPWDLKEVLE